MDENHENDGGMENLSPAAIYVRMSTEHQRYSTENQSDAIREYAEKNKLEIVRTYSDDGKSGLNMEGRPQLKRLIDDVQKDNADFGVILVYDISRWGRFQDADESAYYEYICRRAGRTVVYCAEQFENDGSPVSTIVKSVKRAMAGEYSRELSTKVFQGQCRLIQLGYRQGGMAGYGLRRKLIDEQGNSKGMLALGEKKSIQTDRVVLVPGPDEEVETVQWIFEQFVESKLSEGAIAESLNSMGSKTDLGRPWNSGTVHQILTNEKYIGNNVFNRISFKLKKKRIKNPADMWIRADGVFESIVSSDIFCQAQGIISERSHRESNDELLRKLKNLYEIKGWLSAVVIDEYEETPSSSVYRHRFGSLIRAYELVGFEPERDYSFIETNQRLRKMHPAIVEDVIHQMEQLGGKVDHDEKTDMLKINGEFTTSLVIARCLKTAAGSYRWNIRLEPVLMPDITVAVRLDGTNKQALDYYLLPSIDMTTERLRLAEYNGLYFDAYRFEALDYFFGMAERYRIKEAI